MERIWEQFGIAFADVWQAGDLGVGVPELLAALFIFVFFVLLRGLFTRFVLGWLERITARTETQLDDLLREAAEKPLKFFFLVLGVFFAVEYLALPGLAGEIADKFLRTLVAVAVFRTIYAASEPLAVGLRWLQDILSTEIINWLMTVIRWGIVLVGLATVLQIWGIEIAPIIAGFGLFGVAVALGAQDLFKNLLGGVSILTEKRFALGDRIRVEGVVHGTVEDIGFRSTRIRRFDRVAVIVPNNAFADHALINYSQMTHRRIYWKIGLEYRTTANQLKQIRAAILEWIEGNPAFSKAPEAQTMVFIDSFNDSSIDMMVYCFTESVEWHEWLAHKQELAYAIKGIVEEAGAGFAFPSLSVYHETLPEGGAERFVPPEEG